MWYTGFCRARAGRLAIFYGNKMGGGKDIGVLSNPSQDALARVIRYNTVVLALCMALGWSVVQLVMGSSAVTLSHLTGSTAWGGLAPGVFLLSWAIASLFMGRLMDARGRAVGLRAGFAIGVVGTALVYGGVTLESVLAFLSGLTLVGICCGTVNLARAGGADMYPRERRARGISFVLLGAAVGAIISPIVFAPLLAGVHGGTGGAPWLVVEALLVGGLVITYGIRIDPVQISKQLNVDRSGTADDGALARPLRRLIRLPTVPGILFAAVVAQGVMTSLMSIIGVIMIESGHDLAAVSLSMSVHFVGMFGLVLVAGQVVDWLGRQRSIVLGLLILAFGVLALVASPGLEAVLPGMLLIGVGWNVSFVGSTTMLSDATRPVERARLLGFSDFASASMAALGAVLAGVLLGLAGLIPLVMVGSVLVLLPMAVMLSARPNVPQP
ncbi:MAG: MFS transporter [Chloroflexi bacterium]|nr:MFS transporter [Chloroflexota bacterium]